MADKKRRQEDFPEEFDYNRSVKERLIEWKEAYEASIGASLNYTAIVNMMETRFGIYTTVSKISQMFDADERKADREIKLRELVALAQLFDIPLWDICRFPNEPAERVDPSAMIGKNQVQRNAVAQQLNSIHYGGDYYCYYFKPKHYEDILTPVKDSVIEEAHMNIELKDGRTVMTLTEMKSSRLFFGEPTPPFTLSGDLIHLKHPNIAYSFLMDRSGRRAMMVMFRYIDLSVDIRYYITAAMTTFSLNEVHEPLFQKMSIFKLRQKLDDPETASVVRGILSLNTTPIIIDKETLNRLTEEDEALKQLVAPEKALKEAFVFSEAAIRSNAFFIADEDTKTRKMLKLRENSLYPAHELVAEHFAFADFIREFQLKQLDEGERS